MMRVGIRAGLLGGLGELVLSFFSLIPLVGSCLMWLFNLLLWVVLGALVAQGSTTAVITRENDVALAGGLAGLLAGAIGGLLTLLLAPLGLLLLGGSQGALHLLPPELLRLYREAGVDPRVLFSPTGVLLTMSLSCGLQFLFAPMTAAFSAAAFYRWWQGREEDMWEEEEGPFMLEW